MRGKRSAIFTEQSFHKRNSTGRHLKKTKLLQIVITFKKFLKKLISNLQLFTTKKNVTGRHLKYKKIPKTS